MTDNIIQFNDQQKHLRLDPPLSFLYGYQYCVLVCSTSQYYSFVIG